MSQTFSATKSFALLNCALIRTVAQTVGQRMAERVVPVYIGLGLVCAVLFFGDNGMSPREFMAVAQFSAIFRCGLYLGWLALTAVAARQMSRSVELAFLLSFPILHWQLGAALITCLLLANTLWIAAWAIVGFWNAIACTALCLAGQILVSLPVRPISALSIVALSMALAVDFAPLSIALGLAGIVWGLRELWRLVGQPSSSGSGHLKSTCALWAAMLAQWLYLWRKERTLLAQTLAIHAALTAYTCFPMVNNVWKSDSALYTLALCVGAIGAMVVAYNLSTRLAAADAASAWTFESLGVSTRIRWLSIVLLNATLGIAVGLFFGSVPALVAHFDLWICAKLALICAAWFAGLTVFVTSAFFYLGYREDRGSSWLLLILVLILGAAECCAVCLAQWAIVPVSLLALVSILLLTPALGRKRQAEQ